MFFIVLAINSCDNNSVNKSFVHANIEYVRCQVFSSGARSMIKVKFNDKKYNIRISKDQCEGLIVGDSIKLVYVKNKDRLLLN